MSLLYLLCNATYVTSFNKPSDLRNLVTNLKIYDSLSYEQFCSKNVRCPSAAVFSHIFTKMVHAKIGSLTLGVGSLSGPFKTKYLR